MVRTFSSALMVGLILAALLWGNCFSCPQMLASTAHSCCHKKSTSSAKCQSQNLQHFVKAETHAPAVAVAAEILAPAIRPAGVEVPAVVFHFEAVTAPPPTNLRV